MVERGALGPAEADSNLSCYTRWPQVLAKGFENKFGRTYCVNAPLQESRARGEGIGPHSQCIALNIDFRPEANVKCKIKMIIKIKRKRNME